MKRKLDIWRYASFGDLAWAKALVAALASARSAACQERSAAIEREEAAYKTPEHGYVVKFLNDDVGRIAWAAFVQCLVTTKERPGYGEVLARLPPRSRRVFPRR